MSFTRALRTTENDEPFAIEKVGAAYVFLTNDKVISSTEAAKLVPLLEGLGRQPVEGCSAKPTLGGKVGVFRYGDVEEEVVALFQKSEFFQVRKEHGSRLFGLKDVEGVRDQVFRDLAVNSLYGNIRAVAIIVHNTPGPLTPSQRATLLALLGGETRGLEQLCDDAKIVAGRFRDAFNSLLDPEQAAGLWEDSAPSIRKPLDDMGEARARASEKIELLRNAEPVLSELRQKIGNTEPHAHMLLDAARLPGRWGMILDLWGWFIDQHYAMCRAVLAWKQGRLDEGVVRESLAASWSVCPVPTAPYDRWLQTAGAAWRRCLASAGSEKQPAALRQRIQGADATFAHHDLAGSSLQKEDRTFWLDYAANVIDAWANLFGVHHSATFETQAESGFLWCESPVRVLLAAAWSTYSLYANSEIHILKNQPVKQEWMPVFCLCIDSAEGDAIGPTMASAAKVTKQWTRPHAERVAQGVRALREHPDSLEDRVFLLGKDLLDSVGDEVRYLDRADVAKSLGINASLVTVRLCDYLPAIVRSLPAPNALREAMRE